MMLIDLENLQRDKWLNLDDDLEDIQPLPTSKKEQYKEFDFIREDYETDDIEEIHKIFESMYGYRPVSPMSEDLQKRVLDVFRRSRETDDPVKLRALFEEKYGFKPTI